MCTCFVCSLCPASHMHTCLICRLYASASIMCTFCRLYASASITCTWLSADCMPLESRLMWTLPSLRSPTSSHLACTDGTGWRWRCCFCRDSRASRPCPALWPARRHRGSVGGPGVRAAGPVCALLSLRRVQETRGDGNARGRAANCQVSDCRLGLFCRSSSLALWLWNTKEEREELWSEPWSWRVLVCLLCFLSLAAAWQPSCNGK